MKLTKYERPGMVWPTLGRLAGLQDELDRLFESPLTGWAPALDVQEDADNFTIRVELPGLKREDIGVSLQEGALVISGERKEEKISEGTEVHRQERFYGKFQRALTLPAPVAPDKAQSFRVPEEDVGGTERRLRSRASRLARTAPKLDSNR